MSEQTADSHFCWSCKDDDDDDDDDIYYCFQKRLCLEAELRSAECPMEIAHTFTLPNQQQEQQVRQHTWKL